MTRALFEWVSRICKQAAQLSQVEHSYQVCAQLSQVEHAYQVCAKNTFHQLDRLISFSMCTHMPIDAAVPEKQHHELSAIVRGALKLL